MNQISISQNLKQAMDEKNMSQARLAVAAEIGKSSISQYLSGKNKPRDEVIKKMAAALGISVARLNGFTNHTAANESEEIRNVPVAVAAMRLNKSEQFVRVGLQSGVLPFGVAVKMSSVFTYHISPKLLDEYIGV